ncbi:MAG: tyrosine-type recombinase/integrase [Holdemania massiliensis]
MLRHSFTTHLLDNGVDLRTVQELLGQLALDDADLYAYHRRSAQEIGRRCPSAFHERSKNQINA